MPNSWRKVTRLSENEEAEFIQSNGGVLRKIAEVISSPIVSSGGMSLIVSDVIEKHTRIYKQETKGLVFYRLINSENMNFNNDENTLFLQSLLYNRGRENILLATAAYRKLFVYQDGANYFYSSINIIEKNDSVSGILLSLIGVNQEHNALLKDQIAGSNHSFYFRWEDISGMTNDEKDFKQDYFALYYPSAIQNIQIGASGCLVDPQIPLRYSIQNAFDGDPATSYVENSEDDLMKIEFQVFTLNDTICQIAMINGYAQNETLYNNNNRVKKIGTARYEWNKDNTYLILDINDTKVLCDDCLSPQILETDFVRALHVLEIYKGNKYNDTCIAEIDIFVPEYGWLFGDINE
jgi:hypothetical protein